MTIYNKWRKPRGGVKKEDGKEGRLCMHCKKQAVHSATRKSGKFVMKVWFCDDHKQQIKDLH